eukprot:3041013-Pleurochrysis_carterae.AAC.2
MLHFQNAMRMKRSTSCISSFVNQYSQQRRNRQSRITFSPDRIDHALSAVRAGFGLVKVLHLRKQAVAPAKQNEIVGGTALKPKQACVRSRRVDTAPQRLRGRPSDARTMRATRRYLQAGRLRARRATAARPFGLRRAAPASRRGAGEVTRAGRLSADFPWIYVSSE